MAMLTDTMIRDANEMISPPANARNKRDLLTDVTPDGCMINRIVAPDNRVDEGIEAAQSRPDHVETCTRVPCYVTRRISSCIMKTP